MRSIAAGFSLSWIAGTTKSTAEPPDGRGDATPAPLGWAMIPVRATIPNAPATHEIKRERYARKEQQEMNERSRGEMNRMIEKPKQ
jgi:hypothetical protein